MRINNIDIYNFRNYERLFLEFNNNINIFIGNNGEGKTNILESIYVLALTKSHRSYTDKSLITNSKNVMKLKGEVSSLNEKKRVEMIMSTKGKKVSINNQPLKRISDYISTLSVVLFSPDDLDLIKGSPGIRRKNLNIEIGQIDNKYLFILNEFNQLLKTRNDYLKKISYDSVNKNYLDVINSQIVEKAEIIYKYRYEYIKKLSKRIEEIGKKISNYKISIKYINNIDINKDTEDIKGKMINKLDSNLNREIMIGNTLFGPHKDDIEVYINGKSAKEYGSQGQQRICVLCIKFAELEIYNDEKKEYPILLLDDVFSELDSERKNAIVRYINKNIQVFITSTDINDIDREITLKSKVYMIKNGNIV